MKPVIFYHAHCTDGFGAALAAWQTFTADAEYVPMQYGTINSIIDVDLLGQLEGRDVFILDFSFPRPVMEHIINTAKHTTWLDHHKTAFEMWTPSAPFNAYSRFEATDPKFNIILDNTRSGARIAWDFFVGGAVPRLIMHIDDYDRWQFNDQCTKAFGRALRAKKPWSFEQWNQDFLWIEHSERYEDMIELGQVLLDDHQHRVESAAKHKRQATFHFANYMETVVFTGLATNAGPDMASDVGHTLANESGTFGMVYHISEDMRVKVSLRSNGDYDVSAIAKRLGGGGHRNAAGCEITMEMLMSVMGMKI
jgi:oligoribonuclease NrnB/cAMP/cGMP phosphodiesterase (DHH superfamily)